MKLVDNYQSQIHRHSYKPGITFAFFSAWKEKKNTLYKYIYDVSQRA